MFEVGYPARLWEYAMEVACYTYSRVPNKSIDFDAPYKRWFGKQPSLENLRKFGCKTFTRNTDQKDQSKLSAKGILKFMLSYTNTGYKLLDPTSQSVSIVSDVHCIQHEMYGNTIGKKNKPETKWNPLHENEEGAQWLQGKVEEDLMVSGEEVIEMEGENDTWEGDHRADPSHSIPDSEDDFSIFDIEEEILESESDEEPGNKVPLLAVATLEPPPKEPQTVNEALTGPYKEVWKAAMLKEYASVKDSGAITLMPRKKGQSALDLRWLFRVKPQPDGSWLPKARIVIRGFK